MRKIRTLVFLLCVQWSVCDAQQSESYLDKAQESYAKLDYATAAGYYQKLIAEEEKPEYIERLATCYRQMRDYGAAETWYRKVLALNPAEGSINHYYYAEALQFNGKYKDALEEFKLFNPTSDVEKRRVDNKIQSCIAAEQIIASPTEAEIKNEEKFNTTYSEFGTTYHQNQLIFVSDRAISNSETGNKDNYKKVFGWTNNPYLKLYAVSGLGTASFHIHPFDSIPGRKYHMGPVVFNAKGDRIYFTATSRVNPKKVTKDKSSRESFINRLELYYSKKTGNQWSQPIPFPYNEVSSYSVGHPALSPDGKTLYFASDMPGGMGGVDLYYVDIASDGGFGKPVNLGPSVNTTGDEVFPVVQPSGQLFFSSDGQIGLGGLDIFMTSGEKANWQPVKNVGVPFNSSKDDFGLTFLKNDSTKGYFASNRENGKGLDDIYSYTNATFTVKSPPASDASLASNASDKEDTASDIHITRHSSGKTYALNNIYYDFDSYTLRSDAFESLEKLLNLLQLNPKMEVKLASHTDSRGDDAYNLRLSIQRAQSVVDYLISKGIEQKRLHFKGYGERKLINDCANGVPCTDEEHQQNRRTEFTILFL